MNERVGNVRWYMISLVSLGVMITTLDRSNLAVVAASLMKEFGLTQLQVGILLSAFAWSYAIAQIPVGLLLDKIGVKWVMRVTTLLWAAATFMTAIVSGMGLIILSRVILGLAEGPTFPSGAKSIGYWFPKKERGRAHAIIDGSARLSNAIGVPIVAYAATEWGWRGGFWVTGILSLVYGIVFWIWYRDPKESKLLSESEKKYLAENGALIASEPSSSSLNGLGFVLRQKKVWGLTIGYACYTYTYYLFITWLPGYLTTQMHMTILKSGIFTVIPWLIATIADLTIAGWLLDYLISKGYDSVKVRKTVLVTSMGLGLTVIGAAFTTDPVIAITFLSISLAALSISAATAWTIPALVTTPDTVATVGGVMNFLANAMGVVAPIVTGYIAGSTGTFSIAFIVSGVLLAIGILCYIFMLGRIEPIKQENTTIVKGEELKIQNS
jgi:MFS transporter, ACS family, D-galactonate transporter